MRKLKMVKTSKYMTILLLLAASSSAVVAQVRLSIPDTSGARGNKITLPVYVDTSLTGKGVEAYQIQLSYNSTYMSVDSVISTGTLSQTLGPVSYNISIPGMVSIASAGSTALTGTGVLIYVRFILNAAGLDSVSFSGGGEKNFLNEGNPSVVLTNGSVDVLAIPSNLRAVTIDFDRISMSWNDSANNVTGFVLQRTLDTTTSWSNEASLRANFSTWSDTGLNDGTEYYYRLCAVDSPWISGYSNVASAITPLRPPTNLTASQIVGEKIKLQWQDNSGSELKYYIERKTGAAGTYGVIDSVGTNVTTITDSSVVAGSVYYYRVRGANSLVTSAYSNEVNLTVTGIRMDRAGVPDEFDVSQNYPNPFNPSTNIAFQVPSASHVTIRVYDMIGREVATLANADYPAGYYNVTFDANGLSSGVYLFRVTAGGYVRLKKMVLMK